MNLQVFHSLVRNFPDPAILSSLKRKSYPSPASEAPQNLKASAPNLTRIGSGSTKFPRLFLMALPWASWPSPPIHACLKGSLPVSW